MQGSGSTWRNGGLSKSAGFTLIEVLVVLAIIGMLTAIAVPRLQIGEGTRLRAIALTLDTDLRRLRSAAKRSGEAQELKRIDEGYIMLPAGLQRSLPDGVHLQLENDRSALSSEVDRIVFFAGGDASGGRLTLRKGTSVVILIVRDLDGRVTHESQSQ